MSKRPSPTDPRVYKPFTSKAELIDALRFALRGHQLTFLDCAYRLSNTDSSTWPDPTGVALEADTSIDHSGSRPAKPLAAPKAQPVAAPRKSTDAIIRRYRYKPSTTRTPPCNSPAQDS